MSRHLKLRQLVPGHINFVAVDNFQIAFDFKREAGGFSQEHVDEALDRLEALSVSSEEGFGRLNGIIYARSAAMIGQDSLATRSG